VTNGSKTAVIDVIGFLCVSLGSSTFQLYDSHAHVQMPVSVGKMAHVNESVITEEQRSALRFFVGKRTQYKGYS
jgi:hypothetical protein